MMSSQLQSFTAGHPLMPAMRTTSPLSHISAKRDNAKTPQLSLLQKGADVHRGE